MCNDNAMNSGLRRRRQFYGKGCSARPVEEQTVRVRKDPPFGTPYLCGRLLYSLAVPPTPVKVGIAGGGEVAILVGKYNDVVFEDDEEIANLFAMALLAFLPLVPVDSRITPERQEGVVTESLEVPLRPGDSISSADRRSRLARCVDVCAHFRLPLPMAKNH